MESLDHGTRTCSVSHGPHRARVDRCRQRPRCDGGMTRCALPHGEQRGSSEDAQGEARTGVLDYE